MSNRLDDLRLNYKIWLETSESNGNYVMPAIVEAAVNYKMVQQETFAPIVYLIKYSTIEAAILLNNQVPQGLSH